jgi:hypothetical protein
MEAGRGGASSEGLAMSLSMQEFMEFCRNRQNFDPNKYVPYQGEWIAFNREGTEIILHSVVSPDDLWEQLRQKGLDPSDHLVTYIDGPGDILDGEFILFRAKAPGANPASTNGQPSGGQ